MKKTTRGLTYAIVGFIIVIILLKSFSGIYVNYQWFKDLGYTELFTTPILAKIVLFLGIFLLSFAMFFASALVISKNIINSGVNYAAFGGKVINMTSQFEDDKKKTSRRLILILGLITGVLSLFIAGLFMERNITIRFLKYFNATDFNITDPIFSKDVSFYIFKLPFINQVLDIILTNVGIILFVSFIIFLVKESVNIQSLLRRDNRIFNEGARKFMLVTLGIGFIVYAIKKYFSMYSVMYSKTGYVFGAGNTDVNIAIPTTKILALLSLIIGIICFIYIIKEKYKTIVGSIIIYVAVFFIVGVVASLYQSFYVANNEFVVEKPYIEHELEFTRQAYDLNDIKTQEYPGKVDLTIENIRNNEVTMDNIRLNDPKALRKVLSQNQGLRYYYSFGDIDIDRYFLDGEYRQVMIAPREMDEDSFKGKAETFINQTMRYTHGYGVAATLANDFDVNGYARLIIKDVPPQSSVEGLDVKEPRIYFGEMTNDLGYGFVIVNTSAKEFDYPQGDTNIENVYQGTTGLKLSGFNKLALSLYYDTFRFYLANEVKSDSKLLMKRNIEERVKELMPYLLYDFDPYIVIDKNGKLYWMLDAYTHSNKFPYSMPYSSGINYIRNSVKVVIDAYNGEVDFYVFEDEPVINTLKNIFPNTFKNGDQMPADLREHVRYPEGLFRIQLEILRDFHVKDSSVFYNKEDTWEIAKKAEGNETSYVDPYYTIMKLQGEENEEFILMSPFTPVSRNEQQRNNLVAWFGARCDGDKYGELVLYKMPKNIEVQGPLMIDSMIDQNPEISSKMTLWGQGGSSVIRGNLLAVPVDDGFIYVEPIYIEADREGSSIPQLQAIVLAIDKKLVMVETNDLDVAVAKFFGTKGLPEKPVEETPEVDETKEVEIVDKEDVINRLRELRKQLEQLENDLLKVE